MVDYNQSLSVAEAIRRVQFLEEEALVWVEEPTRADDFAGHARIAAECRTPIQIGENLWGPHDLTKSLKSTATIQRGIKDVLNTADLAKRSPVRGFIILTADQKEKLKSQTATDGTVPVSAVEAIAAKNGSARPTTFLQRSVALPICSPETSAQRLTADAL
jgi:hypothetical protein